ncbi:uncharacterized protein [Nicotiana tomentosiformis]|uniref:uncharacterized protein n=1 Tax=Nicotiana tomentosiformis TaxID=4098 RepID=UPI00388CEC2E
MSEEEQKRLELFRRLRPPSFSGDESEDAQDFLDRPTGAAPLTWYEFLALFLEKFVPHTRMEELRRQFEQLRQEGMSVTQYVMRFSELAHHAIWLVPTERERIKRFTDGLNYGLRFVMTQEIASGTMFDDVVDIARRLQ